MRAQCLLFFKNYLRSLLTWKVLLGLANLLQLPEFHPWEQPKNNHDDLLLELSKENIEEF